MHLCLRLLGPGARLVRLPDGVLRADVRLPRLRLRLLGMGAFVVRDGGGGLADVAYEAVMVCGATEPVIAELVGARR